MLLLAYVCGIASALVGCFLWVFAEVFYADWEAKKCPTCGRV